MIPLFAMVPLCYHSNIAISLYPPQKDLSDGTLNMKVRLLYVLTFFMNS